MNYMNVFRQYWKERFSLSKTSHLVKAEQWLSDFIDSDFCGDWLLSDEAFVLYELVRDECVKRVAMISDDLFD